MMITFVLITTVLYGLLALIWSHDSLLNALLKIAFLAMTVWGVGMILSNQDLFLVGT